jgi:serine/threonine protein kinase
MKDEMDYHYRLIEKIGEGTYGIVYKAVDQRNDTLVAFKKVMLRKAEDGLPKEFLREIESLKRL